MDYKLNPDDPRIGSFNSEGGMLPPQYAINGAPCNLRESSVLYFAHDGARHFVVIPVLYTETFTVEIVEPVAPKAAKPKAVKGDE